MDDFEWKHRGRRRAWKYVVETDTSVIDYVVVIEKVAEEILEMTVEDRTESDHMPINVRIQGSGLPEQREERMR